MHCTSFCFFPHAQNAPTAQSLKAKENRSSYLWLTFWLIIRKEDNVVVGMIDFKNIPNTKGEVEIGYGLGKKHEHFGYMICSKRIFLKVPSIVSP